LPDIELAHARTRAGDILGTALREAGEIALRTFRGPLRSWTKAGDSPVTEADIAVDEFLRARLASPGVGWLSEESIDDPARLDARQVWIVDPIDGTRAYLAGYDDWSISAALVEKGRPVVAALYAPAGGEFFFAEAGNGTVVNGVRVGASPGSGLGAARVAGPRSYLERLRSLAPEIVPIPKIHSLALRLARVGQGKIEAAFASRNARDWDLAAADLLVHEAGGALTTITGLPLLYNRPDPVHGALLAAGKDRHETMLELVRERWKDLA
jgi:myo-inositol-1(or 4)-monophosphatase